MSHVDLMAGPPPTLLPEDPASAELDAGDAPPAVVRRHPASPTAWAALADQARAQGADDVTVYAYARVGYHRSLDLLRRNGYQISGAGKRPTARLLRWYFNKARETRGKVFERWAEEAREAASETYPVAARVTSRQRELASVAKGTAGNRPGATL